MKYDGNDDGYLSREDATSRTSEKLLKVTLINIFWAVRHAPQLRASRANLHPRPLNE